MAKTNWHLGLGALACTLSLVACTALRGGHALPDQHPEALGKGRPVCTECHEADDKNVPYADFNHTPDWVDAHRQRAYQHEPVCGLCHQTSFCNDCHVTRNELKPSLRRQTDTYRRMPHRGDYLSRHRIDARLDPTACFRCHGNPKSARTCAPCHG